MSALLAVIAVLLYLSVGVGVMASVDEKYPAWLTIAGIVLWPCLFVIAVTIAMIKPNKAVGR